MARLGHTDGTKFFPGWLPLDWNARTIRSVGTNFNELTDGDPMCVVIDRYMEVYAVGFAVTTVFAGSTSRLNFGVQKPGVAADPNYFANITLNTNHAAGVRSSVLNNGFSWLSTADTEAKRILPPGSIIYCSMTGASGTGSFAPGVIVRPTGEPDTDLSGV